MKKIISLIIVAMLFSCVMANAEYYRVIPKSHEIANSDFNSDYPAGEEDPDKIFGWNVTYTGTRIDLPGEDFSYADDSVNDSCAFGIDKGAGKDGTDCLSIYAAKGPESTVYVYSDPIECSVGEKFTMNFEAIKHHQGTGTRRACTYIGLVFSDSDTFDVSAIPSPQENPSFLALGGSFALWTPGEIKTNATGTYVRVIAMLDHEGIGQANIDNISLSSEGSVKITDPVITGPLGNVISSLPSAGRITVSTDVTIAANQELPVMLLCGIYDENGILQVSNSVDNFASPKTGGNLSTVLQTKSAFKKGNLKAFLIFFEKEDGKIRIKSYMPLSII